MAPFSLYHPRCVSDFQPPGCCMKVNSSHSSFSRLMHGKWNVEAFDCRSIIRDLRLSNSASAIDRSKVVCGSPFWPLYSLCKRGEAEAREARCFSRTICRTPCRRPICTWRSESFSQRIIIQSVMHVQLSRFMTDLCLWVAQRVESSLRYANHFGN
jgi:hypothetical protein